ncbi:TetR/AcrR family transcriptional regulator [Microbacterium rhizophilus]|uniref:TetR/AcrR family transcriptional regulator n=1 Tax=Microbacterium rhizophilus TaxID=3138934 RepID=UPI0031EFC669
MPKVSDAHRASRRDQILDAALACFAEKGFRAASMADIISASGLSAGAIYSYFGGKREIAIGVAKRTILGRVTQVIHDTQGTRVPPPSEVVRRLIEGLDREGIGTALIVQLWGEAVTEPDFESIAAEAFGSLAEGFAGYLESWAAQERGLGPEAAARWAGEALPAMLAFGQGAVLQSALLPGFDAARYARAIAVVLA